MLVWTSLTFMVRQRSLSRKSGCIWTMAGRCGVSVRRHRARWPLPRSKKWSTIGTLTLGHKEWSYPLEAMEAVVEALAPFSLAYSAQATLLLERVQRERRVIKSLPLLSTTGRNLSAKKRRNACRWCSRRRCSLMDDDLRASTGSHSTTLYVSATHLSHDLGLGKHYGVAACRDDLGACRSLSLLPSDAYPMVGRSGGRGRPHRNLYLGETSPVPEANFVLIGDEAQMIQNLETRRTKAFLALAERASAVFAVGQADENAQRRTFPAARRLRSSARPE